MNKNIVVAIGGNALGNTPAEQLEIVKGTAETITDLSEAGFEIAIVHGNGPQVGMINKGMDYAFHYSDTPEIPFPECGAMSQGYIGYHLQQAIQNEMWKRGLYKNCASVITQVVVNADDAAFHNPAKPIGNFYTREEAEKSAALTGYVYKEDAGRGYRRVVPSPVPKKIIELEVVKQLMHAGDIVIAAGGGGIPVIETAKSLKGIDAVIDKDRSAAQLAIELDADIFLILTAIDGVYINFNKPNQQKLNKLSIAEASRYIEEKQFGTGSMLPKVQACIHYLNSKSDGFALITSLDKAKEALYGKSGTRIYR